MSAGGTVARLSEATQALRLLLDGIGADRRAPVIYLDPEDFNDLVCVMQRDLSLSTYVVGVMHRPQEFTYNGIKFRRRLARNPQATEST